MAISYNKLLAHMDVKGESINSLKNKGVITDYAGRLILNNDYISLKHVESLCVYFDKNFDDLFDIKRTTQR